MDTKQRESRRTRQGRPRESRAAVVEPVERGAGHLGQGRGALGDLRDRAAADEHEGNRGVPRGPGEGEFAGGESGVLGDRRQPRQALLCVRGEVDRLVARDKIEPRARRDAIAVLAGEEPGAERAVADAPNSPSATAPRSAATVSDRSADLFHWCR